MPEEGPPQDLQHIAIEREPDIEAERSRRKPPPPPPRVVGRSSHGRRIASEVTSVADSVTGNRQQAGVDPSRLLVLEFGSWDAGVRDIFETRLSAAVVDESISSQDVTRVVLSPGSGDTPDVLADRFVAVGADVSGLRIRRGNSGDITKAQRAGVDVPAEVASRPSDSVVIEVEAWDDNTEQALLDLGIAPISVTEEKRDITRVLVQFATAEDLASFQGEAQHYVDPSQEGAMLPAGMRRSFFDGLEWARSRVAEDRMGARLRQDGFPDDERFVLDVDLWHPGTSDGARVVIEDLRTVCRRNHGRVIEDVRTSSLVLARVEATRALADLLLGLDIVAQVNLPPVLPPAYSALFNDIEPLPSQAAPDGSEPIVTVVDTGVLSGHPLLRGWVLEERDFDTGEGTPVDRHGHGTQVAGLALYGDVARSVESGEWNPKTLIASAKVLRRDPVDETRPVFPDEHRPEKLVEDAIRYFHAERACRVFNLSVGNADDVYAGGRQFAWAELLDQLARELDIVLVVSAGNFPDPPWHEGATRREEFQEGLRDLLLESPTARICSPGTASIAITVGAITRSDRTDRHVFAAAPSGALAPFSRLGPGYQSKPTQRAVKPEFVSFGGNFAVRSFPGRNPDWARNDIHLGEPTTRLNTDGGRPLTATCGTSVAAPQVSFAAAMALTRATDTLGSSATANSARAVLGACAQMPPCGPEWLRDPENKETWEKLRMVGYGRVDVDRVLHALQNDVCLLAEDTLPEDHWHIYAIRVPPAFCTGRGRRGINVSLSFDPPVRSSRRDYLSRTMWIEVLKGLTLEEIGEYRTRQTGKQSTPALAQSKLLKMRPTKTEVVWSTLQVRRCSWARAPSLPVLAGESDPVLHVLVGCQQRFPSGEDANQKYSLVVRLWHSDAQVELHQQVRTRVRARAVARVRVERRV